MGEAWQGVPQAGLGSEQQGPRGSGALGFLRPGGTGRGTDRPWARGCPSARKGPLPRLQRCTCMVLPELGHGAGGPREAHLLGAEFRTSPQSRRASRALARGLTSQAEPRGGLFSPRPQFLYP